MNLGQARVVIRERAVAELVDLSFRFVFGLERRVYARLSALVLLPAFLACAALRFTETSWAWVWCAALALRSLCDAPFTIAAGRSMFEKGLLTGSVLRAAAASLPRYFFATLLRGVGFVCSLALVVLVPIGVPRLLFLGEIVLLERSSLREAFRRSERFLGRRRWTGLEIAAALLVMAVAGALLGDALGEALFGDLLELGSGGSLWVEGGSYFALFGFFAATPFVTALRYLSYIDVRTRREAWDVQVVFQRVSLELGQGLT